jgi:hypothetical protein
MLYYIDGVSHSVQMILHSEFMQKS